MDEVDRENKLVSDLDKQDAEGWLVLVRWMAKQLAEEKPQLLLEIVCREAQRRAAKIPTHKPSDHLHCVFADLRLRVVVV